MENLFAGLFGVLLGSGGIWLGRVQLKNLAALKAWKTTPGKVIERGTFRVPFATLSVSAFQYAPLVKYCYHVHGQEFINDAILPQHIQMPEHSTLSWAQRKANSFPHEVTVYFSPIDPAQSFLVRPTKTKLYLVLVGAGAAFLYGAVFLLSSF